MVKAFELAPEGIITEIYPMQGNSEALELDVLREHERKKDAVLAKETGEYTLGGPDVYKRQGENNTVRRCLLHECRIIVSTWFGTITAGNQEEMADSA